jgi:hypothetical protein
MLAVIDTDTKKRVNNKPLTPEEIRANIKSEGTVWFFIIHALLILIGLFLIFATHISDSIWCGIIGYSLITISFLTLLFTEDSDDVDEEYMRKFGGAVFSIIFLLCGFFLLVSGFGHIISGCGCIFSGCFLHLLGFILAFRVSKTYGIVSVILLLGLYLLVLLE